jgi:hypothetical protein
LVAVGAAAFVDIGMHLNGNAGATQIKILERDPETVELVARLQGTSANRQELDRVVSALGAQALTQHATWDLRTVE